MAGEAEIGATPRYQVCRRQSQSNPQPPVAVVLLGVLDHELNIQRPIRQQTTERRGNASGQDFVVVFGRDIRPVNCGNNGAVRERDIAFTKGPDRQIVSELSA